MSTISLEQQKQLGRQLERLQQGIPGLSEPDEKAGQSGQISGLGFASFIMLGGFALLKDIFDFVFVSMLNFESWQTTVASIADYIPNAAKKHWIVWLIEAGKWGLYFWGQARDAVAQSNAIILPFLFTNMFMIIVVAVLLLSGLGLKSYKIFLSARFIFGSLIATIAEIVPVLNVFPWTTIFVIFLYFHVKRELKKQQEETQTA
ncbi:MAG: hypothetical protein QMD77_04810 [Patescibacteria group bacterium]|nr:hypothetical protein [Patescibacteria group bacterium]